MKNASMIIVTMFKRSYFLTGSILSLRAGLLMIVLFLSMSGLSRISQNCHYLFSSELSMCMHMRWVTNKYTHDRFLVSCGHCEACLQEKADRRAQRIKNEFSANTISLFITLTYDRFSCPYVLAEDVKNVTYPLPVYRDMSFMTNPKTGICHRSYERVKLCEVTPDSFDGHLDYIPFLKKSRGGKIGVTLFKDIQDFHKRLRQNLKRHYHFNKKYEVYSSFEYGERTFRPHAHLVMSIPIGSLEIFRNAIVKSWPFADPFRTAKGIEIARSAADYVASYVNQSSNFPRFLKNVFPPKHSFSQNMGVHRPEFSLHKILEKVKRGSLTFDVVSSGSPTIIFNDIPVPKYVINRFFPIFKGFSRLASYEILDLLRSCGQPSVFYHNLNKIENLRFRYFFHPGIPYDKYTSNIQYFTCDMESMRIRLYNAYVRYHHVTGLGLPDYSLDYFNTWNCYKATLIRLFEQDPEPLEYKFDNILSDIYTPKRLKRHRELSTRFEQKCKTRYVNDVVFT